MNSNDDMLSRFGELPEDPAQTCFAPESETAPPPSKLPAYHLADADLHVSCWDVDPGDEAPRLLLRDDRWVDPPAHRPIVAHPIGATQGRVTTLPSRRTIRA